MRSATDSGARPGCSMSPTVCSTWLVRMSASRCSAIQSRTRSTDAEPGSVMGMQVALLLSGGEDARAVCLEQLRAFCEVMADLVVDLATGTADIGGPAGARTTGFENAGAWGGPGTFTLHWEFWLQLRMAFINEIGQRIGTNVSASQAVALADLIERSLLDALELVGM